MIHDDLLALEKSFLTAEGRTPEHLDATVSDDFLEIGNSGRTYDKREAIAALKVAPVPADLAASLADFRVREIAPDVALVTYRTRLSLRSSIWRREAGAWRIYFHQGTAAPPPEEH
ncbi:MAG TPA: DUF4440 domain-containing protein [Polyangiaceae bacterium]|nr:DUF4440 domain-containing protein [Polyangiaceae bacterium]